MFLLQGVLVVIIQLTVHHLRIVSLVSLLLQQVLRWLKSLLVGHGRVVLMTVQVVDSVQGSGMQTFQLAQNPGVVAVDFQKDNSKDLSSNGTNTPDTSTMTVQIIDQNENIVATQSTSADAGVVSVSHTF